MADVISTHGSIHAGHHAPGENYLNSPKGIKSWLTTVDHKRIGVMYLWSVLFFSHRSYHSHRTVPLKTETIHVLRVMGGGTVILATLAFLLQLQQLSRAWFVLFAIFSALVPGWPLKSLVGENSPSLCPTMFSVTKTGMCRLPL